MINSNYIWQISSGEQVNCNYGELHHVILQLLRKRGIVTPGQIHRYIHPDLNFMYNPMLLKDMDKAVVRIREALAKRELITVYGDYDVDGITSCCVIIKLLKKLGGHVDFYIPSRLHEGYGLSKEAIEKLHEQGTSLIITVDNGMGSYEEVDYASELGIDVVITDHHEPQEKIPRAIAIVNPKQNECDYPFKELAGVGVALKLAQALTDDSKLLNEFLELAALGTVADIVPLLDENRIIVKNGIELLRNTSNKGLLALIGLLNLDSSTMDTRKISYMLAPRLNAAGRIANPRIAVELLLCNDDTQALNLAQDLEKTNQERQALEAKTLDEAKSVVEQQVNLDTDNIIVISHPNWHPGVIGTVSSKLIESYCRPCILIAEEGDEGRGSGRSVPGFNLFDAVSKVSKRLLRFGGHEQAIGLGIKVDNINVFKREINQLVNDRADKIDWSPKLNIDLELNQQDINLDLAKQLELMEPFGFGNKKPIFMCKNMHIKNVRTVGNGDKHLKLSLKSSKNNVDAIGFNFGLYKEDLDMALIMDIAFHLEVNRWRDFVGPQLNIKDIKVPFLQDKLLNSIEQDYYCKFYSSIKISNNKILSKDADIINNDNVIIINDKSIRRTEYVGSLLKNDRSVIVVINTPYRAWQLLTFLKNDNDLDSNLQILYDNSLDDCGCYKNVIIINPKTVIKHVNFDDIVFYDTPFSIDILKKQFRDISSRSRAYVLFEKEDLYYNYMVCEQILPSIKDLKAAFNILKKLVSNGSFPNFNIKDIQRLLYEHFGVDLNYSALLYVFDIFQEMDIIEYKIKEELLEVSICKNHDNMFKLENSYTYMKLFNFKRKVVELYNQFFNVQLLLGGKLNGLKTKN